MRPTFQREALPAAAWILKNKTPIPSLRISMSDDGTSECQAGGAANYNIHTINMKAGTKLFGSLQHRMCLFLAFHRELADRERDVLLHCLLCPLHGRVHKLAEVIGQRTPAV